MFLRKLALTVVILALAGVGYKYYNGHQSSTTESGSGATSSITTLAPADPAASATVATGPQATSGIRSSVFPTTPESPVLSQFINTPIPDYGVRAWITVDVSSGQILGAYQPDEKIPPASLTKLMSASLIFHALQENRINLDQMVTVSEKAWRTGGSRMFIKVNTQVKIADLLQGMLVQSGNDATMQLAETVGGSEEAFVSMMNKEAQAFGMLNTHFEDPTGLPAPEHYTTVRDLSILAQHIVKDYPQYYHYFSENEYTFNNIKQQNRNGLLNKGLGVDGLKTGHTEEAGYCLISTALRDGRRVLTVVVGAPTASKREQVSQNLLDWGFQSFSNKVISKGDTAIVEPRIWEGTVKNAKVGTLDPLVVTIPRGQEASVQQITQINGKLVAPLTKGQAVGNIQYVLNGKVIQQAALVSLDDVEQAGFVGRMWDKLMGAFFN